MIILNELMVGKTIRFEDGIVRTIIEKLPHQDIPNAHYYKFDDGLVERDVRIHGEIITLELKNKTWEDELKKKLIELMFDYYEHGANMHTIIPDNDAKPILADIDSLLKEQREKYYYHIENSVGTKEADYIDKMVNIPPTGEKK